MDELLAPYMDQFVAVYLDDITIYSVTFDLQLQHVPLGLDALRQANLMLNAEKCHFFLASVNLLGHVINREGIQPDDEKIVKVKNYPAPTTLRQLRGFLGLASYYRKFIQGYSTTEQECLAVVWAVEHDHQYLGNISFYLITDHSALQWLRSTKLKGRRGRWILRLEP